MSGGMIWLRHYSNKRTDPRVKLLTLKSKAVYYLLSEVAAQCDAGGSFVMNDIQLTDQQIAHLATIELGDLKTAVREMKRTGLISVNGHGPFLTDFAEEQIPQETRRKQWRARQQKKRQEQQPKRDVTRDMQSDVTPLELRVKSLESESLLLLSPAERESLKPGWSREAALIAVKSDKPATYAKGILKNWIKEGKRNEDSATIRKRNPRRNEQPRQGQTPPTSTELDAARKALARRKAKV